MSHLIAHSRYVEQVLGRRDQHSNYLLSNFRTSLDCTLHLATVRFSPDIHVGDLYNHNGNSNSNCMDVQEVKVKEKYVQDQYKSTFINAALSLSQVEEMLSTTEEQEESEET